MAESTLSASVVEFRNAVARRLGYGRDYTALTAAQQGDIDEVVNRGYRKFLSPSFVDPSSKAITTHVWSFLRPMDVVSTSAPYSTGTITVASGVVTLASGTWPSWAAEGDLQFGGNAYQVSTRDSNTQLTLEDTSASASAGTSYELTQFTITMPDDFAAIDGYLTYPPTSGKGPVPVVNEGRIRELRELEGFPVSYPRYAALRPITASPSTTGQRWQIMLFPAPDAAYRLDYRKIIQTDALTTTNKYPVGGMIHSETIMAAVLLACHEWSRAPNADAAANFQQHLLASVAMDRRAQSPQRFGLNLDSSDRFERGMSRSAWVGNYVTYNGTLYE